MITIIILPLLSLYYLKINGAFNQYRIIEINMPMEHRKPQTHAFIKSYAYKKYNLSNNDILNNKMINQIDSSLKVLKEKQDTINGVNIQFDNQVKYKYFINSLNLLMIHDCKKYLIEPDNIWIGWNDPTIYFNEPRPSVNYTSQDIIYRQHMLDSQKTFYKEKERLFSVKLRHFWPLGLIYILLTILSFLRFRKIQ